MGFGTWELLLVLAIVLLLFGPRRLKNLGADLGNAIKGFRRAVSDKEDSSEANPSDEPKPIDVTPSSSARGGQGSVDSKDRETHA